MNALIIINYSVINKEKQYTNMLTSYNAASTPTH